MKKSIVLSLLLFLSWSFGRACIFTPVTNYYIFKVVPDVSEERSLYDAAARRWADYCNGISTEDARTAMTELTRLNPTDFGKADNAILRAARERKDEAALAYLRSLVDFLHASSVLHADAWEYPGKAQLAAARATLHRLRNLPPTADKWSYEYQLLRARSAFALGDYAAVARLWEGRPKGRYAATPVFRNLYAGALTRLGRTKEAVRIYAEQNDSESLRFLVYHRRNLSGIRAEYADDPDSPLLPYLVEDFVTNVQETYDNASDTAALKDLDRRAVMQREQRDFIAFARKVVAEKRTHAASMWQSALAVVLYYGGEWAEADRAAESALDLPGTPLMHTNARDVRVFTHLAHRGVSDAVLDALVPDLRRWMQDGLASHSAHLLTRLLQHTVIPAFEKKRRPFDALLARSADFYDSTIIDMNAGAPFDANAIYGTDYFDAMDALTADSLKSYYAYLHEPARHAWQQLWKPTTLGDKVFFSDFIGTHLIRECRFEEALPWLEVTAFDFIGAQRIAVYANERDYKVERWFKRQPLDEYAAEERYSFEENPKLLYCRDVIGLQDRFDSTADPDRRRRLAYRLATYLAQASAAGDCWYLSRYGNTALPNTIYEGDLATPRFRGDALQSLAIRYLAIAAGSTDRDLHERALVGLAWLPADPYYVEKFGDDTFGQKIYRKNSRQFKAYMALAAWRASGRASATVSHCDILTAFARDNYRRAVRAPRQADDVFSLLVMPAFPSFLN